MKTKVIVIGGGIGGLSSAISLASEGYQVQVLEANERIGGKCNIRSGSGYTFDTGPSILTMPWTLEQLFTRAGRKLSDYLTIKRIEPQWRTFFEDGVSIDLKGDLPDMLAEIDKISPEDKSGFLDYLHYSSQIYELCTKSFYQKSLSGLKDLRTLHSFKDLLAMDPMKSMNQATKKYIRDPHIQQFLDFLVMYVGSSPYQAPAVLSQLAYVQFGLGVHYVEGGMYNIIRAMERVLHELDVEICTNARVERIIESDGRAQSVQLASGEIVGADIIVSNLEVIPTYNQLLSKAPKAAQEVKKLSNYEPSVSGLVLLLGINHTYPQLAHHNFFFSKDPKLEFKQIFEEKRPADDPTVYVGISSKSDPLQAPIGAENHFVLTHVPPLKDGENWDLYKDTYRETVLTKLERNGLTKIREHIEFEYVFTPNDLNKLYGSNGGSIYGVAADRKTNGGFKIPSRSQVLSNLYFVGGSTHPGGGVPMVTLSGQLTADLILEDELQSGRYTG
ncbi:phytoene desaturase family protein [Alkalicoccobacillus murimartini]|uniref:4,4'-diaponeurosporene oxygenase n=1 Tax=Alkalicoccobacillus murimartini TaxID=171685 RepID=A0ABT9YEV6_9BACI|nr:phytoene desaturase family protein [Alkalicoccobacillus murimartini]MDQ0206071.1 diapolycopene oxygenase [Alkalicoccobacillus murimartini]